MGLSTQAKILTPKQEKTILTSLQTTRYTERDRAMFLLSLNNHQLKLVGSSYGLKVRIRVKDPSARAMPADVLYQCASQHVHIGSTPSEPTATWIVAGQRPGNGPEILVMKSARLKAGV